MKERVILGLSGGVDSAVAAELLKKDYEVLALYLDIGQPGGVEAAAQAADKAGIPLTVRDIRAELERVVCAPFAEAWRCGLTPNPCVLCNPGVKMRSLCEQADRADARYIATGHYAVSAAGRLYRGRAENDQSYMLCRLEREQIERLLLPLGPYTKAEVRALAREWALPAAERKDSMEICFIPDNDHAAWLEKRGICPPTGDFLYDGKVLGSHPGIHRCTVGQHRGLGVSGGKKLYVTQLRPEDNTVVLGDEKELWCREIVTDRLHLFRPREEPFRAAVRVRHTRNAPVPCLVRPEGDGAVLLCDEPVRAPAPGQEAALYDGAELLGSGRIV